MYNPKSHNAEEFISHEEILDTLKYAEENKNNVELINKILEKARLEKGLSHREASVLLACELEDKNQEIFELAKKSNKITTETELFCLHLCICQIIASTVAFIAHTTQKQTYSTKKLSQEEIAREVMALQDMGHKRLALETGEDPVNNPIEYILDSIKTIYSIKHKTVQYVV